MLLLLYTYIWDLWGTQNKNTVLSQWMKMNRATRWTLWEKLLDQIWGEIAQGCAESCWLSASDWNLTTKEEISHFSLWTNEREAGTQFTLTFFQHSVLTTHSVNSKGLQFTGCLNWEQLWFRIKHPDTNLFIFFYSFWKDFCDSHSDTAQENIRKIKRCLWWEKI